jgi:hypothetical protein
VAICHHLICSMNEKKTFKNLTNVIFQDFPAPPWPRLVKPQDDELITSWLTRLARRHLLRFYSFCSSYFPDTEYWNRDLDKQTSSTICDIIVSKTGLSHGRIKEMQLCSHVGKFLLSIGESKSTWIIPLNLYVVRRKHQTGLSICPLCLRADGKTPYFRKIWRLSTSVVCEKCHVLLIDNCPKCKSEINFLHSERGKKMQAPINPISYCWKCSFDLSKARFRRASKDEIIMQKCLNEYIHTGYAENRQLGYSHLYFQVIRKIITLLNKPGDTKLREFQKAINKHAGYRFFAAKDNRKNSFDSLKVRDRRQLLLKAFWVLNDWPHRFRAVCSKVKVHSKVFLDDFKDCPYWFYKEVNETTRLVYYKWRQDYPQYSYSSFSELTSFRVSKYLTLKKRNQT